MLIHSRFIKYFQSKLGFYVAFYFSILLILVFLISVYKKEQLKYKIRHLYYQTLDLKEVNTDNEEKVLKLINQYKGILKLSLLHNESYFSILHLSNIYNYILNDNDEAIFFLEKLYANMDEDFYLIAKIVLNLGHYFLNLAKQKEDEIVKLNRLKDMHNKVRIESYYEAAIKFYKQYEKFSKYVFMEVEFYKYLGLAYEKYADFISLVSSKIESHSKTAEYYKISYDFYEKQKRYIDQLYLKKGKQALYGYTNIHYYQFALRSMIRNRAKQRLFAQKRKEDLLKGF